MHNICDIIIHPHAECASSTPDACDGMLIKDFIKRLRELVPFWHWGCFISYFGLKTKFLIYFSQWDFTSELVIYLNDVLWMVSYEWFLMNDVLCKHWIEVTNYVEHGQRCSLLSSNISVSTLTRSNQCQMLREKSKEKKK